MKHLLILAVGIISFFSAFAQTISINDARQVAINFLAINEPNQSVDSLPYRATICGNDGSAVALVFDINNDGFIIAGTLSSFEPIVGYSLAGNWDTAALPPSLLNWLSCYADDVTALKKAHDIPLTITTQQAQWQKEWEALSMGDGRYYSSKGGKNVNALLRTQWDQADGYNNFCPQYSNARFSYNGRAVTGCVATAMAQIIRYHEYPNVGFGRRSYRHSHYGTLSADFDSAYYDYSMMPNKVYYNTPAAQQEAVSLLCYHCGIAVRMDYENPNHTSGSGAHSNDVPEALKYFGYFGAYFWGKEAHNTMWDSLLRNDLDRGLPVYYSGSNSEGGHAFVCDGYRSNNNTYHFNFGWGGSGDGWYTLSSVNGYSSGQDAVFNIVPSHLAPYQDHYFFAPDSSGDGSSWDNATCDFNTLQEIFSLYNGGTIWAKKGTYLGDTNSDVAFSFLSKGVTIHGGFNGTETELEQRSLNDSAATIFSGNGQRQILYAHSNIRGGNIYDVTFANGYANDGSAVTLDGSVKIERCSFVGNQCASPDGAALSSGSAYVLNSKFYNNLCGAVILNGNALKNSLVAHNDGFGVTANGAIVDGCDIVCNLGTGIIADGSSRIRNSVVWRNDSSLAITGSPRITFCAIEGFGERDSNSNFGISSQNRPTDGCGPFFMQPDTTPGPSPQLGDWHLSSLSPLVDAGDTLHGISYAYDLDYGGRFRNGRTDIGCLEWIPGNGIGNPEHPERLTIFPNPATGNITITGATGLVQIFDIMGQLVLQAHTNSVTNIDVSSLPSGIYLIRTVTSSAKFLKH